MTNRTIRAVASALIISLTISPLVEAKRLGSGGNRGIYRPSYSNGSYSRSYSNSRNTSNQNEATSSRRLGQGENRGLARSNDESARNNSQSSYNYSQYDPNRSVRNNNSVPPRRSNGIGRTIAAGAAGTALGLLAGHSIANANNHNNQAIPATTENDSQINASSNSLPTNSSDSDIYQNQTNNVEQHQGGVSLFWLIMIVLIGFYFYRRHVAKKNRTSNPYVSHHNSDSIHRSDFHTQNSSQTNIFGRKLNNTLTDPEVTFMADGSNPEVFLRFARQRFNHVQAMNTAANVEEIRPYFTPDMFDSIRADILNNQDVAEFYDLHNELVNCVEENGMYIASVRFIGMVSEELGSAKKPFSEVWHFVKPVGSHQDWQIAGIQQDY